MNVRQLVMSPSHDMVRMTDGQTRKEVDDFSADAEFSFLSLQPLAKNSWLQITANQLKLQSGTLFSDPYGPFVVTVLSPTPHVVIEGL